jgi:hypothetical protein
MSEEEVVSLASAANPQEANAWRQALQEAGIRCRVVGEYLTAGVGIGVLPDMYPQVWVHRNDVDKAQAVLNTFQPRYPHSH